MVVFPQCKINLGLHVVSKRDDGFHNIETCFYPVPWTDILEVIKSEDFSFTYSGTTIPGSAEENLCIKAYKLLQSDFNLSPVKIHLHKVIPMGAGLGGGSSDAAFMLRSLNSLFGLNLSVEQLNTYAAKLGSDCSFFVTDTPKLGSGRGEILQPTPVSLKGLYLVIVKPTIHISTAEAYASVKPKEPSISLSAILESPITSWKGKLRNDFEDSVFKIHSPINKIKDELYRHGALYASMSGSGAAVFGIFNEPVSLKNNFEGDYWAGVLK
ncbi:MAG: 4-(cytidine 5'-diphospho)-2-C-methyl-D-erythritol kinase [Flammeovirgaceae bacterium]|jgi:4-diphosphocytidyl-2-C-methyl-D-erythritol kinase|nr:4-(cytidine 5'-diphospho)-2-C-methyl-D-erythritol kinase [Flammeovirgaceae bacterium]